MKLKNASMDDFDRIRSFYWDLIERMENSSIPIGWKKGVYPSDEYLMQSIRENQLFYVEKESHICAAVILNSAHNEGYDPVHWKYSCSPEEVLTPHALAVHPAEQGNGIGTELVQEILDIGRNTGKKVCRLDILLGNTAAEKLYLKTGFQVVEDVNLYYEDTGWTTYRLMERKL